VSTAAETLRESNLEASPIIGPDAESPAAPPLTVLEPRPGWHVVNLPELWRYRELLFFLVWRDVKVRYKQTALGVAWAVLQPLATMVVFSLFFGRLAGKGGVGGPYPLFVLAGLLPWTFFSVAISSAAQSVVGSQNLVTKVYFPRLLIPMGAVGAASVDFAVGMVLLLGMMAWYGLAPGLGLAAVPLLGLALTLTALGVGTLLAALTVAYRDFRYVVPFLVQLWMFATPSIYMRAEDLGPTARAVLPLNPAYGLVGGFRSLMFGTGLDPGALAISASVGLAMLAVGCLYFRRVEREFADII
jgi:lipopolysaccharide transport system permease protein